MSCSWALQHSFKISPPKIVLSSYHKGSLENPVAFCQTKQNKNLRSETAKNIEPAQKYSFKSAREAVKTLDVKRIKGWLKEQGRRQRNQMSPVYFCEKYRAHTEAAFEERKLVSQYNWTYKGYLTRYCTKDS